ncbi:MAG: winged helix-turn-helix transcriptional regulator, partial [Allorhizobium sp.]
MTRETLPVTSDLGGCQIEATLQLLDGKWKGVILHHLLRDEILRFNEIVKRLPSITHRMLSKQLRELEMAGLVARTVYPVVPPRVDYSLTPLGRSLEPVLQAIGRWGQENL